MFVNLFEIGYIVNILGLELFFLIFLVLGIGFGFVEDNFFIDVGMGEC